MRKGIILTMTLTTIFCCAMGIGSIKTSHNGEVATITANAASLGEVKLGTHTGNTPWLASTNRILISLPNFVPVGEYAMQDGSISLIRGGKTFTRGADSGFVMKNWEDYAPDAFIDVSAFGSDLSSGTYTHEVGDVFVVNATFSNGANSFSVKNAKIIINSAAKGDMYVEAPTVNVGYGIYVAEWENSWAANYLPQMRIKSNADISAGVYRQVNEDAITLTRNGTTYILPVGEYVTVGADSNGAQQLDFTLWAFQNALGESYVAQSGDVLTVNGKFTNGAVIFEVEKTEIINLADKPKTHSVVPVYTATITDEAGQAVSSFDVRHGEALKEPETPNVEGEGETVIFDGWYNGNAKWDFSTVITGDITLTPKFISVIQLGTGYTNAKGLSMGTTYHFGLPTNTIANGAYLRPTAKACIKITRGGVETAIGNAATDAIYKCEEELYKIESGALAEWKELQNGDVLTLQGIWTDGKNLYRITNTQIAAADTGARNEDGESIFYSYKVGETFTVTLLSEEGGEISKLKVTPYSVLQQPESPSKEVSAGYEATFCGWYNGENAHNFSARISQDITLKAKFDVKAVTYTVTFVADGLTVDETVYTVENKTIDIPKVPEKEGYTGVWETYALTMGDIVINAIYTKIEQPDSSFDDPVDSSMSDESGFDDPVDSSTSDDSSFDDPVDSSTSDDSSFDDPVDSSTSDDSSFDDPVDSSTSDDSSFDEPVDSSTSDDSSFDEPVDSSTSDDSSFDDPVDSSTSDDSGFDDPVDSSTSDDSSFDEPITSSGGESGSNEPTSGASTKDESPQKKKFGCNSAIGGFGVALTFVVAATVMKKKEDKSSK